MWDAWERAWGWPLLLQISCIVLCLVVLKFTAIYCAIMIHWFVVLLHGVLARPPCNHRATAPATATVLHSLCFPAKIFFLKDRAGHSIDQLLLHCFHCTLHPMISKSLTQCIQHQVWFSCDCFNGPWCRLFRNSLLVYLLGRDLHWANCFKPFAQSLGVLLLLKLQHLLCW